MSPTETLKRTPLYSCHAQLGAKFVPFGGWEMPVQYTGIIEEHKTVRAAAGLFDVSHMGEIIVSGDGAEGFLQQIITADLGRLNVGRAQYGLMLNENGGVVDDLIAYRLDLSKYLLCVNASNTDKDWAWVQQQAAKLAVKNCEMQNASADFGQVALQGPKAREILAVALGVPASETSGENFKPFTVLPIKLLGIDTIVVTTGYTGEDGVEIFCAASKIVQIWDLLLEVGGRYGIKPIGLGARDTLRFEACYPLHGHEIRDNLNPLSSGLGWAIHLEKGNFIGRDVLLELKQNGLKQKLVGLEVVDRGIVRDGTRIFSGACDVGWVTSGTFCPTLNKAYALGVVSTQCAEIGTELDAEVRGKPLKVKVVTKPFYHRPKS